MENCDKVSFSYCFTLEEKTFVRTFYGLTKGLAVPPCLLVEFSSPTSYALVWYIPQVIKGCPWPRYVNKTWWFPMFGSSHPLRCENAASIFQRSLIWLYFVYLFLSLAKLEGILLKLHGWLAYCRTSGCHVQSVLLTTTPTVTFVYVCDYSQD